MNPYDRYNSDNELPRLTDEIIKGKLKRSFLASLSFSLFMLGGMLVAAGVFSAAPISIKNHTALGNYPAYHVICWVIVAVIWLVAGGVAVYFGRDAWRDFSAYRAPYHIVKAKLKSVSYDEFQGMVWKRRNRHYYREAVYSDVFCFDGMEKYPVAKGASDRASEGDEYFIVVFDKRPTKPVFIFSADAYRWP